MTYHRPRHWPALVICFFLFLAPGALSGQIPFDDDRWDIRARDHRVETHQGRTALYLAGGTAWLRGSELRDGVIEFRLSAPASQGFHGVRFRAVDRRNHEYVYLRPHLSDKPDAVQYTPVHHGVSAWQLYSDPRYVLPATIAADRWVHVVVAVHGRRMEVTIDGQVLVFPSLVRAVSSGEVGIAASAGGAYLADVRVRPGRPALTAGEGAPPIEPEAGTVGEWAVSESFPEGRVDGVTELPAGWIGDLEWTRLAGGVRGIADLATVRDRGPNNEDNTVLAATRLRVAEPRTVRVRFGFSDRVRVYLNGRLLYTGRDEYASRDYRFLGTVGLFDELFLPLSPGDHDLWFAVSEGFGGWGITLNVPQGQNVEVHTPARP